MVNQINLYIFSLSSDNLKNYQNIIENNQSFNLIGSSTDIYEAIKKILFLKPEIVFLDTPDITNIDMIVELIEKINQEVKNIYFVLIIKKGMTYNLKKLLQVGINDFVYFPLNEDSLNSILETYSTFKKKIEVIDIRKDKKEIKTFSFFSPKGGVGKTFIALNVSAGLSKYHNKNVLYIDLSFPYSDLPIILNVSPNLKNIYDLMIFLEDNPNKNPKDYILKLNKLNFSIILPARNLIETTYIFQHLQELKVTIENIRQYYDTTIIDLSPRFYDQFLTVFDISDENFGIITSEGSSVILLNQFREEMYSQGISLKMKVLLNKKNLKVLQPISKEWRYLNEYGIFYEFSDDPFEASISNNLGELTILRNTKSKLKKELQNFIELIVQDYYEQED